MRIRLTLEHRPGAVLPIDYRAATAAWMYATIGASDSEFARWLHEEGLQLGHRRFKLFTFGQLQPQRYEARGGTFYLQEGPTQLDVSFYLPEVGQHLLVGLFQNIRFPLGSQARPEWFEVREARILPEPAWTDSMTFQFLTPCCIAQPDPQGGPSVYLAPDHAEFGERLLNNLYNKLSALPEKLRPQVDPDFAWSFQLQGSYKARLHQVHQSRIKGFQFSFQLQAPPPLLRLGYYGGFGEKGASLGFGFAKLKGG